MEANYIKQTHSEVHPERLPNPFSKDSSPIQAFQKIQVSERTKSFKDNFHGNKISSSKESNREGQSVSRFLLNPIHCSKKRFNRSKTSDKSKEVEQNVKDSVLQDAHLSSNQSPSKTSRLSHHHRSQGRFLSFKDKQITQEVPPFCLGRQNISISSSSLRTFNLPICILNADKASSESYQVDGLPYNLLPRRHSGSCSFKAGIEPLHKNHSRSSSVPRFHNKPEKVKGKTSTGIRISGSNLEHSRLHCLSSQGQVTSTPLHGFQSSIRPKAHLQTGYEAFRQSNFCSKRTPNDKNESTSNPEGSFRSISFSKGPVQSSLPPKRCYQSSETDLHNRGTSRFPHVPIPHSSSGYRFFRPNVGRFHSRSTGSSISCQQSMVSGNSSVSHQFQGAQSHSACPFSLPRFRSRKNCSPSGRQQYRFGISQKQGRDKVNFTMQASLPDPHVVRQTPNSSHSELHSYSFKFGGRRSFKKPDVGRLVSESEDSRQNIQDLRDSRDRPLCLQGHRKVPELFLPSKGLPRPSSGCIQPPMGLPDHVCISPTLNHPCGDFQVPKHTREASTQCSQDSPSHSTLLDGSTVASSHPPPNLSFPKASKIPVRSRIGCQHRIPSQEFEQTTPDPVATQRRILAGLGFHPEVTKRVVFSVKKTTNKTYKQSWREWCAFCRLNHMAPFTVSVNKLAKFLLHLFDAGLAYNSIGVHRSAVCYWLQPHCKKTVASHHIITRLMDSFFKERPPKKKVCPPWDAQKVISLLKSWSPPAALSLKQLTFKCVFLMALSTAKRISDLSLLSDSKGNMMLSRDAIMFVPKFGAKTDRPSNFCHQFMIHRNKDDTNLCPVLYIKHYLKVTDKFRSQDPKDSLFLGMNTYHNAVSTRTIRAWLAEVIKLAGANFSPGSTRNLAVSTAYASGVSMKVILDAGNWASVDTPCKHYFSSIVSQSSSDQDALQRAVLQIH